MDGEDNDKTMSQPLTDGKQNGLKNGGSVPDDIQLCGVEVGKHVKIYIEEDEYDPETGTFLGKMYPDDSHIHDEHELAKPRLRPTSKLQ